MSVPRTSSSTRPTSLAAPQHEPAHTTARAPVDDDDENLGLHWMCGKGRHDVYKYRADGRCGRCSNPPPGRRPPPFVRRSRRIYNDSRQVLCYYELVKYGRDSNDE